MNRLLKTLSATIMGFTLVSNTALAQVSKEPNRLIIGTHKSTNQKDLENVLLPYGGKHKRVGNSDLFIVELPETTANSVAKEKVSKHRNVKFVEVDEKVSINLAVNDPYLGSQWHVNKVNAPTAWDVGSGTGVTIAILDTGVNPSHPDLALNVVPGYNFYSSNNDTSDVYGHGTAVAGVAAAVYNNMQGVAGIAGNAKIMPIRVADANGSAYLSTIAQAVVYAADKGARIVNVSFSNVYKSTAVISAADYLRSKNGLLFVSAGNSGVRDTYTGNKSIIAVSASDMDDIKTSWSSYGPYVTMAAPGTGIWTTDRNGGYSAWSGTSFASPLVAGVAALMMSVNPALSAAQIEAALYSSAVDLVPAGRDIYYGYGRVDAYRAVSLVKTGSAPISTDTIPPTVTITNPLNSSSVSGVVNIAISISDNNGLTGITSTLSINNTVVVRSYGRSSINYNWDTTLLAKGSYTITAASVDASGNRTTRSVIVYR